MFLIADDLTNIVELLTFFFEWPIKTWIPAFEQVTVFLFLIVFSVNVHGKILSSGDANAKITVKVFSSLTCPACANFHSEIYYGLKKDFIDAGLVKFEHHPFPLDLAALNAEIILRCSIKNEKKFELLGIIYKKQNSWAVGSDINKINESIKKIGSEL